MKSYTGPQAWTDSLKWPKQRKMYSESSLYHTDFSTACNLKIYYGVTCFIFLSLKATKDIYYMLQNLCLYKKIIIWYEHIQTVL
jgi:hypothetical protein